MSAGMQDDEAGSCGVPVPVHLFLEQSHLAHSWHGQLHVCQLWNQAGMGGRYSFEQQSCFHSYIHNLCDFVNTTDTCHGSAALCLCHVRLLKQLLCFGMSR